MPHRMGKFWHKPRRTTMLGEYNPTPNPNPNPSPNPCPNPDPDPYPNPYPYRQLLGTRGETHLVEQHVARLPGCALRKDAPKKFEPGRRRVRQARKLARLHVALVYGPCAEGRECMNDCAFVGADDRTLLYQEYRNIRCEVSYLTLLYPSPKPDCYDCPSPRSEKELNTARTCTCSN